MRGIVGMPGVGDGVEVAISSVAVGGEGTMVLRWMLSMMLEATFKMHHEVQPVLFGYVSLIVFFLKFRIAALCKNCLDIGRSTCLHVSPKSRNITLFSI